MSPYPLMNRTDISDGTEVLVFVCPKNLTVDLSATSNSEHYSVDTNDQEDQNDQLSTTNDGKMMKPNIQLIQLNNHLVMQYKLRQIYFYLLLKYL